MKTHERWLTLAAALALVAASVPACGDDVVVFGTPTGGAGGSTSSTTSSTGTGGTTSTSSSGTGGVGLTGGTGGTGGWGCEDFLFDAVPTQRPADIVYVVDNSCSMNEEINSIEQNINVNFAQIIQQANIDYRVVMVTDHGVGMLDVCIGPPLGTGNCAGPPGEVTNQFYHYDVNVQSHDSLCIVLDTLHGSNGGGEADQHGMYPAGWNAALRPEALKIFVEITDDGIACTHDGNNLNDQDQIAAGQTVANTFDPLLLQAAPGQFGTQADRKYRWHAVVGLPHKTNPLEAYAPAEPVVLGTCAGGVAPGTGYQWLAKGTDALRFPVCQDQNATFDSLFQDLAADIIGSAMLWCELEVPEDPNGPLDLEKLTVLYTPDGGQTEQWDQVASLAACGTDDDKFHIQDNLIKLCPNTCAKVDGGPQGELLLLIPCLWDG
ncbi:MAG: hypothetical protein JRI68_07505 [Deltaproteobacteria bacterium]|nr:hypothetical protein [Deltaproteobacteria bacterium]